MITVFISSHGQLVESSQLFDELSSNIASTCACAHSDDDHVSVGDAADSLPLIDSKQIYIPAGRREVCVSIKVHNGTSLSEGSPDEWMDTDIVVFLVDLSDRYCPPAPPALAPVLTPVPFRQSFDELKKQHAQLIAHAYRAKKCATELVICGVTAGGPHAHSHALGNEAVVKAWCARKNDVNPLVYLTYSTAEVAAHLSSAIIAKAVINASTGPSALNSTEPEHKDYQQQLREKRRKAFEESMLYALEADRTTDYSSDEEDCDDDYGSVCSAISVSHHRKQSSGATSHSNSLYNISCSDLGTRSDDSLSAIIERSFLPHRSERRGLSMCNEADEEDEVFTPRLTSSSARSAPIPIPGIVPEARLRGSSLRSLLLSSSRSPQSTPNGSLPSNGIFTPSVSPPNVVNGMLGASPVSTTMIDKTAGPRIGRVRCGWFF